MEKILSVGIDLGTTTTQMILSSLQVENTAAPFTVPRMEITGREILYKGHVRFTPLLSVDRLDAEGIRSIIAAEYKAAGIRPEQIQTGAVIITGETARKENAKEVLAALVEFAGDFVVATAGPALESVLAARGAGADRFAAENACPVLHIDIGGGTSNLALFDAEGELLDTGCLNIGGRLLKIDPNGTVLYRSPVLSHWDVAEEGRTVTAALLQPVLQELIEVLEQACGLRPTDERLTHYITDKNVDLNGLRPMLSFSGGVADLIKDTNTEWLRYGDLGVLLGRAIGNSALCSGAYRLGRETIRATVVGAGSHATELSGSTICCRGVSFPMHNLPAVSLSARECGLPAEQLSDCIQKKLAAYDEPAALSLGSLPQLSYARLQQLAEGISRGVSQPPVVVVMEQDMAKALGHALDSPQVVCLDGLHVPQGSYLDLAEPVAEGTALPVIVKTLAFS